MLGTDNLTWLIGCYFDPEDPPGSYEWRLRNSPYPCWRSLLYLPKAVQTEVPIRDLGLVVPSGPVPEVVGFSAV